MRLKPTILASPKKTGVRRGQIELRIQALANDEPVCPLGKDQEPGFFPITRACTMRTKGRRRRKYALIGYSMSQVATTTQGNSRLTARHEFGTRMRYARSTPVTQIQPPLVSMAMSQARLSSEPGCGASFTAR